MVNQFTPDFFHFNILEELLALLKQEPEGTTYRRLFIKVSDIRKMRFNIPTPMPSFSRKIKDLEENSYIEMTKSHPRTFIRLKCQDVIPLVESFKKVREKSIKESLIKTNKEAFRERDNEK